MPRAVFKNMRIIAGRLKGRRLEGPTGPGLRPTSDRLRETLFNILSPRIAGARVLDGFAGTGAIGLEALSRGAAHVTFVERDPKATAVIAKNVAHCGVSHGCAIVKGEFTRLAARLGRETPFDLIVLDPPYDLADLEAALTAAATLMAPDGLLVLEHSRRRAPPATVPGLVRRRAVTAGDSGLAFYGPAEAVMPSPA